MKIKQLVNHPTAGAHIALLAVALIYAANYFLAKAVFAEIPPLGMVSLRSFISWIIFVLITRIGVRERIQSRSDYIRLAICGMFGAAFNQIFFFKGLSMTFEVNAAVLMTTSPLFVLVAAFILKTEQLTWLKILGLALAGAGALLLSLNGRAVNFGQDSLMGDLMIIFNAASYGIYLVLVRPLMQRYHPLTIVMWVFTFGCIINVPVGIPDLISLDWSGVSSQTWAGAAYIILFVTVGTYSLNGWALKQISSSAVGVYIYLQPVLVALLSFIWATRPISAPQAVYMLLVLGGVYLVTYRKKSG